MAFSFYSVPHVVFEAGCSEQLPDQCRQLNIQRPLLVTDQGIVRCGLLEPVLSSLQRTMLSIHVYDQVVADPPESNVYDASVMARECDCDGVIGFGGGSSMDVAKLVAVLLGSSQTLGQIYGVDQVLGRRFPLIQVPTTAGTGSEATSVAIVTTGESTKAGVVSQQLFADTIILDPVLTIGLPAAVTAATGIDAMVHAIEAYTSIRLKNPLSDMLAKQALTLLSANLMAAFEQGDNLDARGCMLLGAMLAGQAFANAPVGAVHALAYPLGGVYHIPHGLSNSLVLPHVLRFNAGQASHWYSELADSIVGVDSEAEPAEAGEVLANYFLKLATDLSLPTRLREMKIEEQALPQLAEQALLQQRLLINNPREVTQTDALQIYQQAY